MSYLMESKNEASRLLMKSDERSTREQLILTGLKSGMHALDAGGGAGFVTKIMGSIVGSDGSVTMADQSEDRLSVARTHVGSISKFNFLPCNLESIPAADGSFDYVFCRFVFEYLSKPSVVFDELKRVTKPGGKLVIGDLDHNLLSHYPLDEKLERQLQEVVVKLEQAKYWDAYAGRKLYSLFFKAKLADIKVHLLPHHLFYGQAADADIRNWEAKIDQIKGLIDSGVIKVDFEIEAFRLNFMNFFKSPSRFSYSPLILVEAVKN